MLPLLSAFRSTERAKTTTIAVRSSLAGVLAVGCAIAVGSAAADEPAVTPPAPSPSTIASASSSATATAPDGLPPLSPPRVSMGLPRIIRGTPLPKSAISALRERTPLLEGCYREAIEAAGDGEPTIEVRLELVGPGRIASATINQSSDASSTLRACVANVFAATPIGALGAQPTEALIVIAFARGVPEDAIRPVSACSATCDGELDDELLPALRDRASSSGVCFRRPSQAGEPTPLKAGQMIVYLRMAEDGSVCGVSVSNDQFKRPSLTSCIVERMSAPFVAKHSGCIDVAIPLVFKGN